MILSMTGFGATKHEDDEFSIGIEVKSLNSKFTDLNVRIPRVFNDKELEIRNLLTTSLKRGKIAISIDFTKKGSNKPSAKINAEVVEAYYNQLKTIAENLKVENCDLLRQAVSLPNTIDNIDEKDSEELPWDLLQSKITEAIQNCVAFRQQEGDSIAAKFSESIFKISGYLEEIVQYDQTRIENVKNRIKESVMKLELESIDQNRFEQELVYYIEKIDINEEKVRLKNHLKYFMEVMNSDESNGKKLGFIGQEIGREINTIGSKANDAVVQKIVVNMKDELEQIKEQVANVL